MQNGRKRVFILYTVLSMLSCLIMQYPTVWTLCIGKVFHGVLVTIVMVTASKQINETVPVYLLDTYGAILQVFEGLGLIIFLGFGMELPQENYDPSIKGDPVNDAALKAD